MIEHKCDCHYATVSDCDMRVFVAEKVRERPAQLWQELFQDQERTAAEQRHGMCRSFILLDLCPTRTCT